MESTDKLRDLCADVKSMDFASVGCDAVLEFVNEIEREIAERYMELPMDADDVPIHVGDKMEREGQQFVVCAIAPAVIHSRVAGRNLGEGLTTVGYRPEDCRHVKQRTIEDVLTDFAEKWMDTADANALLAKYADELRNMGVSE